MGGSKVLQKGVWEQQLTLQGWLHPCSQLPLFHQDRQITSQVQQAGIFFKPLNQVIIPASPHLQHTFPFTSMLSSMFPVFLFPALLFLGIEGATELLLLHSSLAARGPGLS